MPQAVMQPPHATLTTVGIEAAGMQGVGMDELMDDG